MKKHLFLFYALLTATLTYGHDSMFLTSKGKRPSLILEVSAQRCLVFKLDFWVRAHLAGGSILLADTLFPQADGRYVSKQNSLRKEGTTWVLFHTDSAHAKPKRIKLHVQTQKEDIFYQLNDAYWWSRFFQLTDEINARYKPLQYSFREGYTYWRSFSNQTSPCPEFQAFADEKIQALKDSLVAEYTVRLQHIQRIVNLPYASLKDTLPRLPSDGYGNNSDRYLVVNTLIHSNPVQFLQLAQDLPHLQKNLFQEASADWTAPRILKSVDTTLPAKKAYIKYHRKENILVAGGITGVFLSMALLGIGIATLL